MGSTTITPAQCHPERPPNMIDFRNDHVGQVVVVAAVIIILLGKTGHSSNRPIARTFLPTFYGKNEALTALEVSCFPRSDPLMPFDS